MFILIHLPWYTEWPPCSRYRVGARGRECPVGSPGPHTPRSHRRSCWHHRAGTPGRSQSPRPSHCSGCLATGSRTSCPWNIYEKINFFLLNISAVEFTAYCIWIFWLLCICSFCIKGRHVASFLKGVDLSEAKKMPWEQAQHYYFFNSEVFKHRNSLLHGLKK